MAARRDEEEPSPRFGHQSIVSRERRPRPTRMLALVAVLAATVGLGGCTTQARAPEDGPATTAEPRLGLIRVPTDPSQIVRPIDQYVPDTQLILQLVRAERTKQIACLREDDDERSIEWPLDEEAVLAFLGDGQVEYEHSKLWGFFDPENASRHGYTRAGDDVGALPSGVPAGVAPDEFAKCSMSVHGSFPLGDGGGAFSARYPSALPDGGPPVPSADSRVEAVVGAWSTCMTKRGFDYPDPISAEFDPRWGGGTSPVTPEQIATATADMDCKAETNLVGIELAVQSAYDQEYIESHREALENMAEVIADYIGDVPDDEKR
ncbi:hypothetical protein EDF22_2839 [Rathayibacter sp. PhB127]|uniref:hypothetical protein n=1 Tax=Rathayibacter sp. PhB127 TaxID=2485176 RepID=UPI000F4CB36D|nr:hypothetical protein [Rathayibacter sp. PhB127]ROS25624.1 hypothetical protein EDF22_2839 [Rathayibacter sp. PhB127]